MAKKKTKTPRRPARQTRPLLWMGAGMAAIVIALAAFLFLQGSASTGLEITPAEALARREAGAFILDVREPEEWAEFHVPGSTLIPLDQLADRVNEVPRDREIVVVCRSGNRSRQGVDILRAAGFPHAASMAGGLREWKAAGYPTVSRP